jgi:ATP:cob(I)alamin adenosyltransferase
MSEIETKPAPAASPEKREASKRPPMRGRIYTGVGDQGQTMLLGKVKVWKDSPRVCVYGTLDEATSAMGLARASTKSEDLCRDILDVQGELIGVMAEMATAPGVPLIAPPVGEPQVQRLEKLIDHYEQERIATGQFVRPGVSVASAAFDLARTVVRRAERYLVTLSHEEEVNPFLFKYINRLSDLLYVMARIDEQREIRDIVVEEMSESTNGKPASAARALDLATCDRLVEAGMRRAKEIGVPMVVAVTDASGNLLELRRMDNALIVSITLAPQKAYTAATVRMPTENLAKLSQPGESLYGIDISVPNLTLLGGGLPLVVDGVVIGAVGASGGAIDQDIDVAQAMTAALH